MNADQRGLLEISHHMHTKEDFLKFTQGKHIKIAQSFAIRCVTLGVPFLLGMFVLQILLRTFIYYIFTYKAIDNDHTTC